MAIDHTKAALISLIAATLTTAYVLEPVPLAPLVLLLGVWFVAIALSPLVGLMATVATLALFHQPLETSVGTFAPSELLLMTSLAATGFRLVIPVKQVPRASSGEFDAIRALRSRMVWALALLAVAGSIALLTVDQSAARSAGLRELRWALLEPLILLGLLTGWCTSRRSRYAIALAWAGGMLISMLPAALDPFTGDAVEAGGVMRVSGLYPHPNAMALATTRAVAFLVALIVAHRMLGYRTVIPVAAGLVLLIATFARSALLAIGAVGLVIAWRMGRGARLLASVTLLSGVLALALLAPDRLLDGLAGGSVDLRVDIWRAGLAMIRDNPVLGFGPDQFFFNYAPRYVAPTGWDERFTSHAHNIVIDSWVRLGIIGAVFAVVALILVARDAMSLLRGRFAGNRLQFAAALALFAALLQGLVDNSYFGHDLAMSFWLLAWLRFEPGGEERGTRTDARARFRRRWPRRFTSVRSAD